MINPERLGVYKGDGYNKCETCGAEPRFHVGFARGCVPPMPPRAKPSARRTIDRVNVDLNTELCGLLGLSDVGSIAAVHLYMTPERAPRLEVTRRLVSLEAKTKARWTTQMFDLVPHERGPDAKH